MGAKHRVHAAALSTTVHWTEWMKSSVLFPLAIIGGFVVLAASEPAPLGQARPSGMVQDKASERVEEAVHDSLMVFGGDRIEDVTLHACVLAISIVRNDDHCPRCKQLGLDAVTRSTTIIDLVEMKTNPVSDLRPSVIPNAMIATFRVGEEASLAFTQIGRNPPVAEDAHGALHLDEVALSEEAKIILDQHRIDSRVNYDTRKHVGMVRSLYPHEALIVRKDASPELPKMINEYKAEFCDDGER